MTFEMDREKHWKHRARGTVYEVLFDSASIQCSANPELEDLFENENWTVYRNVKTGAVWVRLTEEFLDGRFEPIEQSRSCLIPASEQKGHLAFKHSRDNVLG